MKILFVFCLAIAIIMDTLFLRHRYVIGKRSLLQIDMQLPPHYVHPDAWNARHEFPIKARIKACYHRRFGSKVPSTRKNMHLPKFPRKSC